MRRLAVVSLPIVIVLYAWTTLQVGMRPLSVVAIAGTALLASLPASARARVAAACAAWRALAAVLVRTASASPTEIIDRGLADAGTVAPPFAVAAHTELAALVAFLAAVFVVGIAVMAGERPFVTALVVGAGVGIPTTINPSRNTIAMGALALLAVLWPFAVAAMPDRRAFGPGLAIVSGITLAAVVLAGIGTRPSVAAIDWRSWNLSGDSQTGRTVALVWSANYTGISFPPRKTTVLRITAPRRGLFWRATTLETFADDRWNEALATVNEGVEGRRLPPDRLLPAAAANPRNWVKQEVEVRALVDEHLVAATQPVAIDTRSAPPPRNRSGGVLVSSAASSPRRYTVWSYAPQPTPAQLAGSPPSYPASLSRFRDIGRSWGGGTPAGRPTTPPFGASGRDAVLEAMFADDGGQALGAYRGMWLDARRLAADARSPYEATVRIERWLRSDGGFVYDESPPTPGRNSLPPLAEFEQRTKSGYCQHFAGTMALMLRYLGIPARVAVGFSSGSWKDNAWTVTDHDAHAWVEVWFAGFGWLPFDPTPGRGTLSGNSAFSSDSAEASQVIGAGGAAASAALGRTPTRRGAPSEAAAPSSDDSSWLLIAPLIVALAAALALAGAKSSRRLASVRARDPRSRAAAARAELAAFICDQGAPVTSSAPVSDLVIELRGLGVGGTAFASAFARARYGPPAGAAAAADEVRVELRRVLAALRERLGPGRRVRGFVAVRSLRRS